MLTIIIINVLLDRVTFGEQVHDFALVRTLSDAKNVNSLLYFRYIISFDVQNVLTSVKSCFKLLFFGLALAKLPFCLVDHFLLQADLVKFLVQLAPISLESIATCAIVRQNSRLVQCLIFSLLF